MNTFLKKITMKKIFSLIALMLILQGSFAQKKIDRSKPPAAGPAPEIELKDPVIYTMPNGMTVLIVENHKLPKVRSSLRIDAGPITEGDKAGLVSLMGQMLAEGTTSMSKEKFDAAVDGIGADVFLNSSGGSAAALTRYFPQAFMLMADAIKNPALPKESFEKLQTQTVTALKTSEKSASTISNRVINALNYGKESAMGEFVTEESVNNITLDDVKSAYKNYITPSRSYLTFVGDITVAQAKELANKAFGSWTGKKLTLPVIPDAKNPKTEIDFVDVPTAVQGELSVTNLVKNPMSSPDYHALALATDILGGGYESKLFMNLREKRGFTYGAYANVGSGRFQNLFNAGAAVRTEKVDSAIAEMVAEILNMRDGKITEEELKLAKAKFTGSFAMGLEDPARAATFATNILINDLPKDFYKNYLKKINAVTVEDIKRVSKKYFNEDNSRIVIVGNGSKILPNLTRLGYPIKKYDKYANLIKDEPKDVSADASPKTTDKVSPYIIVEDYLKAIGGKEAVKKVNSVVSAVSLDMMGRSFTGTEKKLAPGKSYFDLKMGDMTIMKAVFDGEKGYQMQGPNKVDMGADEIKEAKDEKAIFPQVNYISSDYKTEYLGSGKIDGETTYRLKVVMPSGRSSVQEYSAKSGLLLHEETVVSQGGNEIPLTIDYKNYQKAGEVMWPMQVIRNAGGQEFTINYSDVKINAPLTADDFK